MGFDPPTARDLHGDEPFAGVDATVLDFWRCAMLPLHELCLFRLGMAIGELWHLTPLADALRAQGRSRFLLTAPPLRLPGAVGSPVNPIATL